MQRGPVTGSAALYQVAVALIPALLFGGAVLELRERPPASRDPRRLGLAVAAILGAGVVAEIIAIRSAIDPEIGALGQRYLVFVLTVGTTGLAIWLAAPLLRAAIADTPIPLRSGAAIASLAIAGIAGQLAITESLDHASKRIALEKVSERLAKTSRDLNQAEQIEFTARAQLLSVARSTGSDDAIAVVVSHLHRLDDEALGPMSEGRLGITGADRRVRVSFDRMNAIGASLEQSIEQGVEDLGPAKRELLMLAQRRLISAVAPTIGDRDASFFARREFRRACAEAAFLGCR